MTYNLTFVSKNTTGLLSLTQKVNSELMSGTLGIGLLIGFAIVIYGGFVFSTQDVKKSILATSFIMFLFSLLFKAMSLISDPVLYVSLVGLAFATAFTWKT